MIEPLRILIVDDSLEDRATYKRLLVRGGVADYVFSEAETGEAALANLDSDRPDCILLDYNLTELDGLEFLAELVKEYNEQVPAIVMLKGEGNEKVAVQAMENGVQDYLVKAEITGGNLRWSINNAIEKAQLKQLLKLRDEELNRLAVTNELTGLYSRHYKINHLNEEIYRAQRYEVPFSLALILIDIDHFKQVNDRYGHAAGDQILKEFGNLLKRSTRQLDIAGRYGGGKFLVILSNTSLEQAQLVMHRIRSRAKTLGYSATREKTFHVTCSIGLTEYDMHVVDPDTMIQRAGEALCQAKNEGRNRLCIWSGDPSLDSGDYQECGNVA